MSVTPSKSSIISKSVLVLTYLGNAGESVRFIDLVSDTGLSKGTAHRLLSILTHEGLVYYDEQNKKYRLGFKIMEWAQRVWHDFDLRELALDQMKMLNAETGENINLAVREGLDIIYINRIESFKPIRAVARMGARAPLFCTALGKVLVAYLPFEEQVAIANSIDYIKHTEFTILSAEALLSRLDEVRRYGYGMDDCEFSEEIRCISAPIHNFDNKVIGGISVSTLAFRVPKKTLTSWAPMLIEAANVVSEKLGYVNKT